MSAANVSNPTKGGRDVDPRGDDEGITTVDHHPGVTLLDDWRPTAAPRAATSIGPRYGCHEGSDPSAMLGLVLVLLANTFVVAALVAALILTLA